MEFLLAFVAGLAAFLLVVGAMRWQRVDPVQARLELIAGLDAPTLEELELRQPLIDRTLRPFFIRLAGVAGRLSSPKMVSRTDERLAQAGFPAGLSTSDFLALKLALSGILGGLPFVLLVVLMGNVVNGLLLSVGLAVLGYLAPEFWLRSKIKARREAILLALPDTLDLLTISVRAGLGFDGALAKVVEKTRGPLAEDCRRALAEIRMGKTRREALRDLATRVGIHELTAFVGAVIQAEQLGVPIGRVLQVQSEQMRIMRRQRAEESAAKAPIKMLLPMVGCIFPAMFIVILGPALLMFMQNAARTAP